MAFFLAVMLEGERRRRKRRREMGRKRRREMGRKRRRREMCQELIPEIPFDLVTEILTKLPAKSLMRFKSVSKLWSSLIRSRTFTNRVQRVSSSSLRLYLTMSFFDHNSQPQHKLLSTSSSSSPPSSDDITTMSSFEIETNPGMIGYYLAHVFNGLMCFAKEQSSKIYNTTTRQLVVLPDIKESNIIVPGHKHQSITYRIGHDPVCDQYKVVCIIARLGDRETRTHTFVSEHWVFLLGGGGDQSTSRWRKIPCPSPPHLPVTNIISNINGRMHYYLGLVELLYPPMLVSFDFSSEEICLIQVPEDIHDDLCISTTYFYAIEYYGKVALLDHSDLKSQGMMKLWVLEDAERNMWSNKTLLVHSSLMDIVTSIRLRVQGTTRNNEIIFVPYNPTGESQDTTLRDTTLAYIFLYHLQKNLLRKVEINDTPYHTNIWDVVGFDDDVDNFMYL